MATDEAICFVCGTALDGTVRVVLVRGRNHEEHCSEACLLETVRLRRAQRAARQTRLLLRVLVVLLVAGAGRFTWSRYRCPPPVAISFSASDLVTLATKEEIPLPPRIGPSWPPTDDDWKFAFARASWLYPLPGPTRRAPTVSALMLGPDAPADRKPKCRQEPRCGVELGSDLWGEHVYAALDGVVDSVQRNGSGDGPGSHDEGHYVRIAHLGGMVYTQYFHLAATWHTIVKGAHVKAGDVIGLLGDTGLRGPKQHLHFTLSVRPSSNFAEVFWDPSPWMERWRIRTPTIGTVAGYLPPGLESELPPRHRMR